MTPDRRWQSGASVSSSLPLLEHLIGETVVEVLAHSLVIQFLWVWYTFARVGAIYEGVRLHSRP